MPTLPRPRPSRWTSFVAEAMPGEKCRILREDGNPAHRVRVEHNRDTILLHLSGEAGGDWTVLAVDRSTRRWAVGQGSRQLDAAQAAVERLYERGDNPSTPAV
jgi:hypothetical protein